MTRFGYLVPEFPGQTHSFFWREIVALRELGQEPELVSTRRPRVGTAPHGWAEQARSETSYLAPPSSTRDAYRALGVLGGFLLHRPSDPAHAIGGLLRVTDEGRASSTAKQVVRQAVLLVAAAELAAMVRERRWSHIHVHSLGEAAQVALYAHFLCGVSYSLTLHGPLTDYGPHQRDKWQHAEFAIVITRELHREVHELLNGFLPARIAVAPMGVDVRSFARPQPYQPWDGHGSLKIFSCGRLNPSKGHDDMLRAVRLLRDDGVDVQLRIAGDDDSRRHGYRCELNELRRTLGLDEHVEFLGALPEDGVRAELAAAHLFSLASHAEPLGVATMEAMAMEVPVVVTDAGGVRELVDDRTHGLLVPVRRPDCLAGAILHAVSDPAAARAMGIAARDRIVAKFSSHRSAEILAELLS